MTGREKAAAEIADDLERLGHELRADFDTAVRTIAPVRFSGPVAQLFDRRLRAHLGELNAILATMGVATDDLRITGRSDGELGLRRPGTGHHRASGEAGTHAPETVPVPAALPAQYAGCCRWSRGRRPGTTSPPHCCWRSWTGDRRPAPDRVRRAESGRDQRQRLRPHADQPVGPPGLLPHHDWRDPAANIDYGAT